MTDEADQPLKILLVEDNPADADLIREVFDDLDATSTPGAPSFALVHADRIAHAQEQLAGGDIELVLLDLTLPDSHGFETFSTVARQFPDVPIVVLSGLDDETLAIRAVRDGAQDYLVKGRVDADLLGRTLRYSIERRRAASEREQFRQEQIRIDAAMRARNDLLASISHDFKSPLASIQMQAQLIIRRIQAGRSIEPDDMIERLARIEATTLQAMALIDELLDLTLLEAGNPLELHRQPTDLVAMTRRVVAEYDLRTDQHRLQVESSDPQLTGLWDGRRLERVLRNLIDNALKFSPADSEVVVSVSGSGDDASLRVQDHGLGIPAEDLPHVFERFYRASNATGHVAGTGLGLTGVRQIIEQHGGTIDVESREGHGSTFIMRLPVQIAGS
jgi:signal transduction histidine kinase